MRYDVGDNDNVTLGPVPPEAVHAPAGAAAGAQALAVQHVGYAADAYERVCCHEPVVPLAHACVRVSFAGRVVVHDGV